MRSYTQLMRDEVRNLRTVGFSVNEIQKRKDIPKTTIRGWIKDIKLSEAQRRKFKERTLVQLQKGRIKAQSIKKEKKEKNENKLLKEGMEEVRELSIRELFLCGVALYWAEGFKNKHEHRLGFCNSDPMMMKFYILWLERCLGITRDSLTARLSINRAYENKAKEIEQYWSNFLGIPLDQFTKPFYQKTLWKKEFHTDTYKGVLRIHVNSSLNDLLRMKGWIQGLKMVK